MLNSKAFSLIELSIVLIIIGLLIAGITGGASLIESARNRAFANEILGWKQAVLVFKAMKGRYPGDKNNIGKFGNNSGYTYEQSYFSPPFNTGSFIPGVYAAPYAELYTEKISDFKPTGPFSNTDCIANPCSKIYPKIMSYFRYNTSTDASSSGFLYRFRINIVNLHIGRVSSSNNINPRIPKSLDIKIDDGIYNSGNLRFYCWKIVSGNVADEGGTSYDGSTNTKGECGYGYYDLRLD